MRLGRAYRVVPSSPYAVDATFEIEVTETRYCEDKACEAQHDDPAVLWDTKTYRTIATCYHIADAQRIVVALRYAEANGIELDK